MSDNNNDSIMYTAADIRRYLAGGMSSKEMHELERHALDDPFLADAIEGYNEKELAEDIGIPNDIGQLHQRLGARIESPERKNIIPIARTSWIRIAAMVLLIAGSGTLIYYLTTIPGSNGNLIVKTVAPAPKNEVKDLIAPTVVPDIDSTAITFNKSDIRQGSSVLLSKKEALKKPIVSNVPLGATLPSVADATSLKPNTKASMADSGNVASLYKREKINVADSSAALSEVVVTGYGAKKNKGLTGSVPTTENKPDKNSSSASTTGSEDSLAATINKALSGRAAGIQTTPAPNTQNAEPVMGWPAFDRYLEHNKKIFTDSSSVHGEVIVSFNVNTSGALNNFKIKKSLSKQMDDEAIRLIKEGPAWKVLNNKKAKAIITIKF